MLNLVLRQKYTLPLYSEIVRSLKVKEVHLFCPDLYGLTFVFYWENLNWTENIYFSLLQWSFWMRKLDFCCGGGLLKFWASIEDVQEASWVKWHEYIFFWIPSGLEGELCPIFKAIMLANVSKRPFCVKTEELVYLKII